jgi:exodeoxyribonuclease VII small subunit
MPKADKQAAAQAAEDLPFEQALARLEAIVERLESGQPSLEESLALFEEGTALRAQCEEKLTRAEGAIKKLVDTAAGAREADLDAAELDLKDL